MAKKLSSDDRLKRLLEAGYFPEELPPPFVSASFARYRKSLHTAWTQPGLSLGSYKSSPEPFGVPKFGHARRRIVVVNPVSQFRVAKIIADEWNLIVAFLRRSEITEFRPIIDTVGDRSLFGINWSGVAEEKNRISARYANQFHSDISKFYGSIYTHSFTWAVFGKDVVQANLHAGWLKGSFLDRLDIAVRHGQRNQSVGIPIGPDTSRIISEIVSVGIEERLRNDIVNLNDRAIRYVDDITIGVDEDELEDGVVAAYERALAHFELDVNFEKTKVLGRKTTVEVDWRNEITGLSVGTRPAKQRDQIDAFFGLAVRLAEGSEKDAVLKWAIKRSRSFRISDENYSYYVEWLLRVVRRAPACLRALVQLLVDARHRGRPLPVDSIRKFAVDHIATHSRVAHAFEVAWALFLCKGLAIQLLRVELKDVFRMRSSVCALIALDLHHRGLIDGGVDDTHWSAICNSPGVLKSDMWLLAYEAQKKKWWVTPTTDFVTPDMYFGPMKTRGVYFYDEKKNVPTTRREAKKSAWRIAIERMIYSHWEEYF